MSVAGRENIPPIILAQTEMTWICIRVQRVIAAENLTTCEGNESPRYDGANDRECNSNDGLMNQEHPHSVQDPIAERQRPGDIPSQPKIQWPKSNQIATGTNLDQELSFLITTHLKGPIDKQMTYFCRIRYDVCLEQFGIETHKKDKIEEKRPNRREIEKES